MEPAKKQTPNLCTRSQLCAGERQRALLPRAACVCILSSRNLSVTPKQVPRSCALCESGRRKYLKLDLNDDKYQKKYVKVFASRIRSGVHASWD